MRRIGSRIHLHPKRRSFQILQGQLHNAVLGRQTNCLRNERSARLKGEPDASKL